LNGLLETQAFSNNYNNITHWICSRKAVGSLKVLFFPSFLFVTYSCQTSLWTENAPFLRSLSRRHACPLDVCHPPPFPQIFPASSVTLLLRRCAEKITVCVFIVYLFVLC
jgi:hypothetical protein